MLCLVFARGAVSALWFVDGICVRVVPPLASFGGLCFERVRADVQIYGWTMMVLE
jgi:hypothetical protein